ncbi:MAG: hypothetical protein GJ676_11920 [Rhodobacteraceae bacterium]|nr:hypothetical protein [Paracoccaceae bacterium]
MARSKKDLKKDAAAEGAQRKGRTGREDTADNRDARLGDDKKNTSLRLNRKTLKALKIRAIEEETSVQRIVETLIEDYLSKVGTQAHDPE